MAAPAFAQLGTSTGFSAASSVDVPLPTTVADGEVAFMVVGASDRSGSQTFSWPSGWAELSQQLQGAANHYAGVAWKRLAASDGGTSPTVTFNSGTLTGVARVITFTGAKATGTPFEQYGANAGTSGSSTSVSMTTTEGNELGVILHCYGRNTASAAPTGWTERMDSGANIVRTCADTKTLAAPGTEAATSRTISSDDWITWTFALFSDPVAATLDGTLGALDGQLAATVERSSTFAADLGALQGALAATVEHPASLSSSLGALDAQLAATLEHPAALVADVGALQGALVAGVEHPAALDGTLGALAGQLAATVERSSAFAADLGALQGALAATVEHVATLDGTLGALDGQLAGSITSPGQAVLEAALGALVAAATFELEHPATLAADLGALAAGAAFNVSPPGAILTADLGALSAAATCTVTPHARKIEVVAGPFSGLLDFNPRRRRAQVGDTVLVRLEVKDGSGAVDVSTAPLRQFVFVKPDGTSIVRTASATATLGRLEYRCAAGDLNRAGDWSVQARVVRAGGGELRTAPRAFFVGWNLPTS